MKPAFRKAFKIFKYSILLFSIVYWIYVVIDDYAFIKEYWATNWLKYLGIWAGYYIAYLLAFSFYFWIITTIIIYAYYKLIKTTKKTN
jgi:hypothetical protein